MKVRAWRRGMHSTFATAVIYGTLLAAAGLSSIGATLPSNVVWARTQAPQIRAELNMLAGQNFAFFTRSPETDQIDVYRINSDGSVGTSLLATPQAKASNLFGLSRTQRAQGPELAILLRAVPGDAWLDCTDKDHAACTAALRHRPEPLLRNTSPVPTVCGRVALAVESTTMWAYRRLTEDRYSIERIASANVDCLHGR